MSSGAKDGAKNGSERAATSVDVKWEDQERIISFNSAHKKLEELRRKREALTKDLKTYDDALEEIDGLLDGDEEGALRVDLGEAFIDVDEDGAKDHVEGGKLLLEKMAKEVDREIELLEDEQEELKKQLYATFGKEHINLGDD